MILIELFSIVGRENILGYGKCIDLYIYRYLSEIVNMRQIYIRDGISLI